MPFPFAHDGGRAAGERVGNESVPIALDSGIGHEEIARPHAPRIVGDAGDCDLLGAGRTRETGGNK